MVRNLARASYRFTLDGQYRAITLLRWFRADTLHQTTPLTRIDRYPQLFSACRDWFCGRPEIRILSFGCSTGEEVITLRRYFPRAHLIGAEINPWSLAHCRRLQVDGRIAFVSPDRATLEQHGPFDLIFCMAVLQRTPHRVEADGITNLKRIYPFERFDQQVRELDALLKKDGILVIHHSQYFFRDSSVAARYEPLESSGVRSYITRFDRNSQLAEKAASDGSMFLKTRD